MRSSANLSVSSSPEPSAEASLPLDAGRIEPREAGQGDSGQPSPALLLRQQLEFELNRAPERKWSVRRTIGFLLLVNGAFWITALWVATRLAH